MTRRLLILAVIGLLVPSFPALAQTPVPREIGWVGLFNRQLLVWLENANRIDELCTPAGDVYVSPDCRAEKLRPRPLLVPLRNAPDDGADEVGQLMLIAVPGQSLTSYYLDADDDSAMSFTPDLYLADWGYGPYHHQTYLEQRGDWFLLPEDPFPPGTWLNARALGGEPSVATLEIGTVYRSPRGMVVILGVEGDVVRARAEQRADMWCEAGDPPAFEPVTELRIPRRELYSANGHLLIAPAYMKGC